MQTAARNWLQTTICLRDYSSLFNSMSQRNAIAAVALTTRCVCCGVGACPVLPRRSFESAVRVLLRGLTAGRFDRSGGPRATVRQFTVQVVHLIAPCRSHTRFPCVIPCADSPPRPCRQLPQAEPLFNHLQFRLCAPSQAFETGATLGAWPRSLSFFKMFLRFPAQKCDVAMTVYPRQIHPNSQLPRPNFAGGVVGFAANRQQRAVPRRQLLHQRSATVPPAPPLPTANQPKPSRLAVALIGGSHRRRRAYDRCPVLLMRCPNPKLCTACGGRNDQARMQRRRGTASSRHPCIRRYQDRRRARLQVTHEIWPIKKFVPATARSRPRPSGEHSQR